MDKDKNLSLLYEKFHEKIEPQNKIIGEKNFTYRILIEILERYISDKEKILDIGCGVGTVDFYLANKGYRILGFDISEKAVETCIQSAKELDLKARVAFNQLNFPRERPSGTFDLAICSEVLEHLENDADAVKVIFNLLDSGGIVIFSTPSTNAPLYKIGFTKEFDKKVGHLRRYSQDGLERMTSKSGFVIKEVMKTEGIIRNFLFLNSTAGKLVRILNKVGFLSDTVTMLDLLTIPLFGESNIFLVAQKP